MFAVNAPISIDVWYVNLAQLSIDPDYCRALLDKQELATALNYQLAHLSARYLIVHGLLRQVLASYLSIQPKQLLIHRTQFGKPYLPDYPQLSFNLSHSGSEVLLGVATDAALGVDIEIMKSTRDVHGLVKRCFSEREQAYWLALPENQKHQQFYTFWTHKEAFVKAVGRGIALGLKQCELDLERPGYFLKIPSNCGLAEQWRVLDIDTGETSRAALVVKAFDAVYQMHSMASIMPSDAVGRLVTSI